MRKSDRQNANEVIEMKCPHCGKEMKEGYLFTSKDGAFSFAEEVPGVFTNASKASGFVKITPLKASHRVNMKAELCEACRVGVPVLTGGTCLFAKKRLQPLKHNPITGNQAIKYRQMQNKIQRADLLFERKIRPLLFYWIQLD